jgi:hypothetical protein
VDIAIPQEVWSASTPWTARTPIRVTASCSNLIFWCSPWARDGVWHRLRGGIRAGAGPRPKHIAPGAATIRGLLGGKPILILLDEVSAHLGKVEREFPDAHTTQQPKQRSIMVLCLNIDLRIAGSTRPSDKLLTGKL